MKTIPIFQNKMTKVIMQIMQKSSSSSWCKIPERANNKLFYAIWAAADSVLSSRYYIHQIHKAYNKLRNTDGDWITRVLNIVYCERNRVNQSWEQGPIHSTWECRITFYAALLTTRWISEWFKRAFRKYYTLFRYSALLIY